MRRKLTLVSALLAAIATSVGAPASSAIALSTSPSAVAVAPGIGTVVGPLCPDVMVIAARGSGEKPQNNWTDPSAYADPFTSYGAGAINHWFYEDLVRAAPQLHFSLNPVQYPADVAVEAVNGGIAAFHSSEQSAVETILGDVARTERLCLGTVKYVFAGYSQGAWAVHEALWKLSKSTPKVIGKIVGVALFGDPQHVPFETIIRDNKLLLGLALGAARVIVPGAWFPDSYTGVPSKQLEKLTASYCSILDGVCGATPTNVALLIASCTLPTNPLSALNPCPHTRYIIDGQADKAATFITPNLPSKTTWPRLTKPSPPQGTVGAAYSWRVTAAPTAQTTYTWKTLVGELPPGLTFPATGVLSGTPTKAGSYTFYIQATSDPLGRTIAGAVTVTIKPGPTSQLAIATTTLTDAVVAQPYAGTLTASGGSAPYAWSIASGSLPPGLSLAAAGTISGTPTTLGSASFTVGVRDAAGATAQAALSLNVISGGGSGAVIGISAGDGHTCAVTTGGAVKCWGDNTGGELGNGTTTNSTTPVDVAGLGSGVATVAGGQSHSCAVTAGGAVKCWGYNGYGQLGNGTTTDSTTPVDVAGLASGVAAVSLGAQHTCAVTTSGAVKCWGNNSWGQLGNGTTTGSTTPVDVAGLGSGVAAISIGGMSSCAVTTSGAVKCWGYNAAGELGNDTTTDSTTPVDVAGLSSGVVVVSTGYHHSCAVTIAGAVKCWGLNTYGALGNGTTTDSTTPVDVAGLSSGVMAVSAGGPHSCAVTSSGAVKCWGLNLAGELGNGTMTDSTTPVDVAGLSSGVVVVSAGYHHSCAATASGAAKCWGSNANGALGDGTQNFSATPVGVIGLP